MTIHLWISRCAFKNTPRTRVAVVGIWQPSVQLFFCFGNWSLFPWLQWSTLSTRPRRWFRSLYGFSYADWSVRRTTNDSSLVWDRLGMFAFSFKAAGVDSEAVVYSGNEIWGHVFAIQITLIKNLPNPFIIFPFLSPNQVYANRVMM